jgi:hypothetical protein
VSIFRLGILGLGCALFAFARGSAAQTIMGQGVTLESIGITHTESGRSGNVLNTMLNQRDCAVDDHLAFPVTLAGYAGLSLQVWAGINCDQLFARKDAEAAQCWKVASLAPTSSLPPPISIAVRDLLSGRTLAGPGHHSDDPNIACRDTFGSPGPQSLSVYFMLVDASDSIQGTFASWTGSYKLAGPAPPDHVSLGVGNQQLLVSFSYEQISSDTTINGYQLYCEPDGAADSDAGSPACAASPSSSSRLVAGASTDDIQDLLCGGAGKADTRGKLDGLTNDVPYNVAVATTDSYDNVGVLSSVACEAPRATVPGQAESGAEQTSKACSFSVSHPSFPLLPSIALGLCLLRRRRPRRR